MLMVYFKSLSVCVCRSTPAEAVEGERLGKRVRRKKKMFMDSGDEEEDNIEEEEVTHTFIANRMY